MNKSLALKNKLYLFLSLFFSFSIFLYLVYFLINGERGIISYKIIKNQQIEYRLKLDELKKKNDYFLDRVQRLQANTIDLDYLDEQFRQKSGYLLENELVISLKE